MSGPDPDDWSAQIDYVADDNSPEPDRSAAAEEAAK